VALISLWGGGCLPFSPQFIRNGEVATEFTEVFVTGSQPIDRFGAGWKDALGEPCVVIHPSYLQGGGARFAAASRYKVVHDDPE
jgi:hypothetical protein